MANAYHGRMHWRKRDRITKEYDRIVMAFVSGKKPPQPLNSYSLECLRSSSSEPDYDGLVLSFKPVIDALVRNGILADDKLSNSGAWQVYWSKAKPKKGFISITVTERGTQDGTRTSDQVKKRR